MKQLLLLKFWIKKTFNLPVYRKDVLERVKLFHDKYRGLCEGIFKNIMYFNLKTNIRCNDINVEYIPKFKSNVKNYNINIIFLGGYWWNKNVWTTGRMDYLNWLINEYKDDKTNLRKLL